MVPFAEGDAAITGAGGSAGDTHAVAAHATTAKATHLIVGLRVTHRSASLKKRGLTPFFQARAARTSETLSKRAVRS
jgi:shikimate 5-dehydrogenase